MNFKKVQNSAYPASSGFFISDNRIFGILFSVSAAGSGKISILNRSNRDELIKAIDFPSREEGNSKLAELFSFFESNYSTPKTVEEMKELINTFLKVEDEGKKPEEKEKTKTDDNEDEDDKNDEEDEDDDEDGEC